MIPVDKEPSFPVGVDGQLGRKAFSLAIGMLVRTHAELVQLPEQLGFAFPTGVCRDEAQAVLARRYWREFFPEAPRRFRRISPQLIPRRQPVIRARRSCILG